MKAKNFVRKHSNMKLRFSFFKNVIYLLFNLHLINCAITTTIKPITTDFGDKNIISSNSSGSGGVLVSSGKRTCTAVQSVFENRGFSSIDIPKEPLNEVILRYCEKPLSGTCCTYAMETRLAGHSRMQLEKNTKDSIGKLSSVLGTRAQKFNDFFKDLLSESKKEFHTMFKRTYGTIYEQNAYVFSDLFDELEGYYARGKVDLAEAMDSFFNTLYQKMFTVLNSQYAFDDKYLGCVSEHMKDLKPFGDVPDKLSVQIKRSFVATRTYAQALNSAADIAKNMMNIRPSAECTAALTKMGTCNTCNGFIEKPCSSYCVNVMKGCLQHYLELDLEWDNFVASMDRVSERLLGSFNIVMVVEPINIKISEAIMNFQETGQDISNQVFQGCGKPVLGRRRRRSITTQTQIQLKSKPIRNDDSDLFIYDENNSDRMKRSADQSNRELKYEPMQFPTVDVEFTNSNNQNHHQTNVGNGNTNGNNGRRKNKNNKKQNSNNYNDDDDDSNREPVLDRLIKDIRQKVKDSKKFWSNLPYQLCNNEDIAAPPSSDGNCWNGHTVDRYLHNIASDPEKNPEFTAPTINARHSSIVAQQLYSLKTAISHLRNAYNGHDVEWSDQEESYYGSGSGSGSGIDDDDDTGSGLGPWEIDPRTSLNNNNQHVPDINNINNEIDYTGRPSLNHNHTSIHGGGTDSATGGTTASRVPKMSIQRALATFFLPIFMAWFGGLFSDLL